MAREASSSLFRGMDSIPPGNSKSKRCNITTPRYAPQFGSRLHFKRCQALPKETIFHFFRTPFLGTSFFGFFLALQRLARLKRNLQPNCSHTPARSVLDFEPFAGQGRFLDGRVSGAYQVEKNPFGKPLLKREKVAHASHGSPYNQSGMSCGRNYQSFPAFFRGRPRYLLSWDFVNSCTSWHNKISTSAWAPEQTNVFDAGPYDIQTNKNTENNVTKYTAMGYGQTSCPSPEICNV